MQKKYNLYANKKINIDIYTEINEQMHVKIICFLIPLLQIYSSFFGGGGLLHVTIWPWLHIPVPHVFFFVIDTSLHNISPVCLISLYRK